MRQTSEKATERALDRWEALLTERGSGEIEFAEEILSVGEILRSSPSLNTSLLDPSRDDDARAGLIRSVLAGRVSPEVGELVEGLVRDRWSQDGDLATAIERIAAETYLIGASREGMLGETEEQLFDILRTLRKERDLRLMLNDDMVDISARRDLATNVFSSANIYSQQIVAHAVTRTTHHSMTSTLRRYIDRAANRSEMVVAAVVSVIPLTIEQQNRLQSILARKYGRNVQVHVAIDPAIVGGLRITIGNDVIDGTLAKRIHDVRETITK